MTLNEIRQAIDEQRTKNMELYHVFQYRLHEEEMQPLIEEWRNGSKCLKELITQRNQLEKEEKQKTVSAPDKTFVNAHGEATTREITSTVYSNAQKRLSKQIMNFVS